MKNAATVLRPIRLSRIARPHDRRTNRAGADFMAAGPGLCGDVFRVWLYQRRKKVCPRLTKMKGRKADQSAVSLAAGASA